MRKLNAKAAAAIRELWETRFAQVSRAATGGPWPSLRVCAGCWYVAGIMYEAYGAGPIEDTEYDALSRHLLDNLWQAQREGSDLLSADDLSAGTAQKWKEFPKPYHDVAGVLMSKRSKA